MKKKSKEQILQSYQKYHSPTYLSTDPLCTVHRFKNTDNLEITAIVSALLSYGRVNLIIRAIEEILTLAEQELLNFSTNTSFDEKVSILSNFKYRFNSGYDIAILLEIYKETLNQYGSFDACLAEHYSKNEQTMKSTLTSFCSEVSTKAEKYTLQKNYFNYLMPSPKNGSACKRLNMLFRWMVREDDGIDLGQWKSIPTNALIIPLDTHVATVSKELGLTSRKSPDWKCAEEITKALRTLDKNDPIKFDFSLCRIGMLRDKK